MRLTLLGTGTSQGVPVLGCTCSVCQSQDTRDKRQRTAGLLQVDERSVVIDVGPDFRNQMLQSEVSRLDAILLSHEHNDHMIGFDDVRPYNFRQQEPIKVYGLPRVLDQVKTRFEYIFAKDKYPGAPSLDPQPLQPGQPSMIGGFEIIPFTVLHGSLPILGFRCEGITYITDANEIPQESMSLIKGSRILIVNALHHRRHHSHFNLRQAIDFANLVGAERTFFTHISHSMGLHHEVKDSLPKGVHLGFDGLSVDI